MGGLVDTEANGEKDTEDVIAGKTRDSLPEPITDPVVYQLVRVEGDGRLVPATDDEVIEVEHLLEDEKVEMLSVEDPSHSDGCVSNEAFSSKKSDLEGSEGLSQSENTEISSRKLNARLEFIEVMLQKVKQEERLRLSCESLHSFPKYMDVDGKLSDNPNNSLACSERLQSENISVETAPHPTSLNGSHGGQSESVETCSGPATEQFTSRSSVSELPASLKPDFSILKGEICLDNLTIRELQEVFRATFGRQTSVKDKLWLKRRIAMGLSNSFDPPMTNFVIKEKKIICDNMKEESLCRVRGSEFKAGSLSTDQADGSRNDFFSESSPSPTKQKKDHLVLSGKRLRRPVVEYDTKSESLHMGQIAAKRVRKPTRRYIEELSDVETRECTGTLSYSEKSSGHGQSSPVSRIRPVCIIGSQGKTFVTRRDSLGGAHIQIPYVSRVRRGRPRKNFMALMKYHPSGMAAKLVKKALGVRVSPQDVENGSILLKAKALPLRIPQLNIVGMEREISVMDTANSEEEQDLEHRKIDSSGDFSDENADVVPASKCGTRRKHHRAWTLSEVMKLVDGVARYGTGRWSEIKRLAFASHAYRTSVDLKDKWRNLLKASFAQGLTEKGARKHASMPIPTPILSRVRELAEMHSHPGIEFGPSKFAGHNGKAVQAKGSGFL